MQMVYKIYIIKLDSKTIPLFKFQCGGLCFVRVWNLTRHSKGRTQIETFWEQVVEETVGILTERK